MSTLPRVKHYQKPGVIGGYVQFQVPENEFKTCCMNPVRLVQMQIGRNAILSREKEIKLHFYASVLLHWVLKYAVLFTVTVHRFSCLIHLCLHAFYCHAKRLGARFNKEVQPTLSLNLNSELTYLEMGNSDFSVSERLNCVSSFNSE